jgi:small subunit ribosomal protein S14
MGNKRKALKKIIMNKEWPLDERFAAQIKLNEMPRDGSYIRVRNRCLVTGRPRGNYRKFKMSRIAFRELASTGQVPGILKSSW